MTDANPLVKGRIVHVALPAPMFQKIGGESEHVAIVTFVHPNEDDASKPGSVINAMVLPPVGNPQAHGMIRHATELEPGNLVATWRWAHEPAYDYTSALEARSPSQPAPDEVRKLDDEEVTEHEQQTLETGKVLGEPGHSETGTDPRHA